MAAADIFYKNIMEFLGELVVSHPDDMDLLLARLSVEKQNKVDIINHVGKFINDNITLINNESLKIDPNSLCLKLSPFIDHSKIMKLRTLWLSENEENQNIIIKWLNAFNRIYISHTKGK